MPSLSTAQRKKNRAATYKKAREKRIREKGIRLYSFSMKDSLSEELTQFIKDGKGKDRSAVVSQALREFMDK